MPRLAKPLTDIEVRKAKAGAKIYRKADGNGLYLSVSPAGRKSWLVRYKLAGDRTHRPVTIGHYPAMPLAEARKKAAEVQRDAARNVPTAGVRKTRQLAQNAIKVEEEAHQATNQANSAPLLNAG